MKEITVKYTLSDEEEKRLKRLTNIYKEKGLPMKLNDIKFGKIY